MFRKRENDETSIWISNTDLMSGLLVLFLFLSILANQDASEKQKQIDELSKSGFQTRQELNKNLREEFTEAEMKKYGLDDVENIGYASFAETGANFAAGSSTLTPYFQAELKNFLPKYIRAIRKCDPENIQEIRIEGHTSSEWYTHTSSPNEAYINNMALSQSRTREILNYAFALPELINDHEFIKAKLTANGLSSSHLIKNDDGTENASASRRIEFRVITNDSSTLEKIRKAM